VSPDNAAALRLYRSMGFAETGEIEDDEVVLRRVRED
jgi:ribosomal protein S18 acetylase RimI-like enzyme